MDGGRGRAGRLGRLDVHRHQAGEEPGGGHEGGARAVREVKEAWTSGCTRRSSTAGQGGRGRPGVHRQALRVLRGPEGERDLRAGVGEARRVPVHAVPGLRVRRAERPGGRGGGGQQAVGTVLEATQENVVAYAEQQGFKVDR
ncbi:hypothetical protein K7G98_03005 [Saccharothrix sp. MB29]|nr:hypothetical protein [Saccharothrix sp. MB29]